jgi:hypothetical protein
MIPEKHIRQRQVIPERLFILALLFFGVVVLVGGFIWMWV